MKKLVMYFAVVALTGLLAIAFSACDKEDDIRPMVSIRGDFINTPDVDAGFWRMPLPPNLFKEEEYVVGKFPFWDKARLQADPQAFVLLPKQYIISGRFTHFGEIDADVSILETSNVVLDPHFGIKGELRLTLTSAQGEHLNLLGEFFSFQDNSSKAYLHFSGGTGRFADAEGWMNAYGQVDIMTGLQTMVAVGEITEPDGK
jgi:hypothetical protein